MKIINFHQSPVDGDENGMFIKNTRRKPKPPASVIGKYGRS